MPESVAPLPILNQPNITEDPKILALLTEIQSILNGNVDASNLASSAVGPAAITDALASVLGVTKVGTARRGYSEVLTSQSTMASSYSDLSTVHPAVTVNQPTHGLTLIYASADQSVDTGSAFTAVNVDGGAVNRTLLANNDTSPTTMVTAPGASTPGDTGHGVKEFITPDYLSGGPIALNLPGTHAYRLVHLASGGGTATFANRKLLVWTIGA